MKVLALLLFLALSDSAALNRARLIWGEQARVGTVRGVFDSNWTKQVGFSSQGCTNSFTVMGSGFNTWDAAFLDALMHPLVPAGPFKGMVTLAGSVFDNVGAIGYTFIVDGTALTEIKPTGPTVPSWAVSQKLDTALLKTGMHVLCAQARDSAGNVGHSVSGLLFNVDLMSGIANAQWEVIFASAGHPSLSAIHVN